MMARWPLRVHRQHSISLNIAHFGRSLKTGCQTPANGAQKGWHLSCQALYKLDICGLSQVSYSNRGIKLSFVFVLFCFLQGAVQILIS